MNFKEAKTWNSQSYCLSIFPPPSGLSSVPWSNIQIFVEWKLSSCHRISNSNTSPSPGPGGPAPARLRAPRKTSDIRRANEISPRILTSTVHCHLVDARAHQLGGRERGLHLRGDLVNGEVVVADLQHVPAAPAPDTTQHPLAVSSSSSVELLSCKRPIGFHNHGEGPY